MKQRTIVVAAMLLLLAVGVYAADKATKALKTTRVNDWQVLVSCTNGSKPKTDNIGGSIVLSCEGRVEQ